MPTLLLRPTGDGNIEQLTPSTGSDSWAMVDEDPSDDDTTFLKTPAGGFGTRDTAFIFDYAGGGLGGAYIVNSITVHTVARQGPGWLSGDNIAFNLRNGFLNQVGGTVAPDAAYSEKSHTFNAGNVANFPATVQELIDENYYPAIRATGSNLGDDDIRFTQVWIVIDYTVANAANSERAAKISGQATANAERGAIMAGGDGWYRERFDTDDFKDGATTGAWTGDGEARIT